MRGNTLLIAVYCDLLDRTFSAFKQVDVTDAIALEDLACTMRMVLDQLLAVLRG